MEVLLLQDVSGIGKKNDLLVVGDGFALNHLLPQRKALVATPTVRKRYAEQIRRRAEEKERERLLRQEAAAALAGITLRFLKKVTKTGKLYAGISAENIADELKAKHSLDVPTDAIHLVDHIKTVGAHQVPVKIGDASQTITVEVAAEK